MSKLIGLNLNPTDRVLRQFGFIALFGFGLLSYLAWAERLIFSFGLGALRPHVAGALAALAVISALLSLVYPRGNRALYVGLTLAGYPIGFVMSYVLMGVLYFVVIAPLAIAMRVAGRDALHRDYDREAQSYWTEHRRTRPKADYFKQY